MELAPPALVWLVVLAGAALALWSWRRRLGAWRSPDQHPPDDGRLTAAQTRIAELEAELAITREEHETLDQHRRDEGQRRLEVHRQLVADVSHELKTPLTAIRGYTETLYDGAFEDPDTARRFLGRTLEQCERLEALLRDLLTLSRLDSGQALLDTRILDLEPIARHTLEVLEPRAREARVETRLEIDSPPPRVRADPDHAERLLLNLVENAIKYNRPGGTVEVTLARVEENAQIEIRDTGLGIPRGDLERIFERFYRVDRGRTRRDGGSGLGLAIVAQLVRDLGGQIAVESRLGHGSTFRIALPAAEADAVSPPDESR